MLERKSFHGANKKKNYFEGWYLKHQAKGGSVSFIPAIHIDRQGNRSASIQVITEDEAFRAVFPAEYFYASPYGFYCRIGKNVFSEKGISVDIKTETLQVKGRIRYGRLHPVKGDIMGPFRFLPLMQCSHGVLSLRHEIFGSLVINGRKIEFDDGMGYLEKDWGSGFPKSYLWTQCGWNGDMPGSVFLSVADVPVLGLKKSFLGCIGAVCHEGRICRLATYRGARLLTCNEREVLLRQGKYWLHAEITEQKPLPLAAPRNGAMDRRIQESLCCKMRYRFWKQDRLLFDVASPRASVEIVKE